MRQEFTWITDCKNILYLFDNKGLTLLQNKVLIRLRWLASGFMFRLVHVNANWIAFTDMLNRVGEQSQNQHQRELEKSKRIKIKALKQLSLLEYFQNCHKFQDLGVHSDLHFTINSNQFEYDDDYYHYQRCLIGLREINNGNLNILYNGIDFDYSYDYSILLNNARVDDSINRLINKYDYYTRDHRDIFSFDYLDNIQSYLVQSVITSNLSNSQLDDISSIFHPSNPSSQCTTLNREINRQSNPLAIWKLCHQHGLPYEPEGHDSRKKILISTVSTVSSHLPKRVQFDLNGTLEVSPFNLTTNYPKSILKYGKRSTYYSINITEALLEKSLTADYCSNKFSNGFKEMGI